MGHFNSIRENTVNFLNGINFQNSEAILKIFRLTVTNVKENLCLFSNIYLVKELKRIYVWTKCVDITEMNILPKLMRFMDIL